MRVINFHDDFDGVAIIRSPYMVESLREANHMLDLGIRGVVCIPTDDHEHYDDVTISRALAAFGGYPGHTRIQNRARDIGAIGTLNETFTAHVDAFRKASDGPVDAKYNHRRCIIMRQGCGTIIFKGRLREADFDARGYITPAGQKKLGDACAIPHRAALLFNLYGDVENRLVHMAPDLKESLPSGFVRPNQIIRRADVRTYKVG